MIELILFSVVIIQCGVIIALLKMHKASHNVQKDILHLKEEMKALTVGSFGLGKKVFNFQKNLHHIEQKQQDLSFRDTADKPFEQAGKLFKRGATVEDVVESCHLSKGEAELLKNILTLSLH